jgi:hypothetical protein
MKSDTIFETIIQNTSLRGFFSGCGVVQSQLSCPSVTAERVLGPDSEFEQLNQTAYTQPPGLQTKVEATHRALPSTGMNILGL